jgi:Putative Ig domain
VTTAGSPTPKVTEKGMLPKGVTFNRSTDVLGGTPTSTKHKSAVGTYHLTFRVTFGKGKSKVEVTRRFTALLPYPWVHQTTSRPGNGGQ